MGLEAVDTVLRDPILLRLFRIPSDLWPAMRKSWGLQAALDYSTSTPSYKYIPSGNPK